MATSSDDLSDLGSSDLSSLPSRSPSPPAPPSPQLSQDSVIEPSDDHPTLSRKRRRTADDDARKKKRKLDQQDARIAERLDLRFAANPMSSTERKQLDRLCQALRERRKIVVIAGAGISTAAGSKRSQPVLRLSHADLLQFPTSARPMDCSAV